MGPVKAGGWCSGLLVGVSMEGSSHSNKSEREEAGSKCQPPFPLMLSSLGSPAQAQAEAAGGAWKV